jgi:beta-glucosidase
VESSNPFPPEFVWGVATAAYQIEGAHDEDGRLPSIWDTWSHQPGNVHNGDTGDVACDHYHRWRSDFDLLREVGADAYRFSIAWPRVIPTGTGAVNAKGIDFYSRLVDNLLERGVTPFVTLYHWDLPQVLQDKGGWPARDTAYAYADYVTAVVRALGDRVVNWTTFNEPLCTAWIGYLDGNMAPGIRDIEQAVPASFHLHLAHGLGAQAIRAEATVAPKVGIVYNLSPAAPASDNEEDHAAARRQDGHTNRWWLDPTAGRGYPQDMVEVYGVEPPAKDGDLETIAQPLDYLGVNYYFREFVTSDPGGRGPQTRSVPVQGAKTTYMGWEVYPKGLEDILVRVAEEYAPKEIYVTENGSAWPDVVEADGSINDTDRIDYMHDHIAATGNAIRRGAPVKGYFAWSLLDNFEWAYGYDKRFGLVRVDYETQERTVKASGRRYAEIVAEHHAATRSVQS